MTKSDWYAGFKCRKIYYVLIMLVNIILTFFIISRFNRLVENGRLTGTYSVTDVIMQWFIGSLPVDRKQFNTIDLSEQYMFIVIGLASLIGNYAVRDLNGNGIQIMIRTGRRKWIISKIIWNVCSVLVFFIFIYGFSYIACVLSPYGNSGVSLNIKCAELTGYECYDLRKIYAVNSFLIMMMPFFSALALAMFQMMISLIFSPLISYMLVIIQMIISMFSLSDLLQCNGFMIIKTSVFHAGGTSFSGIITVSVLVWIISALISYIYIKNTDILPSERI